MGGQLSERRTTLFSGASPHNRGGLSPVIGDSRGLLKLSGDASHNVLDSGLVVSHTWRAHGGNLSSDEAWNEAARGGNLSSDEAWNEAVRGPRVRSAPSPASDGDGARCASNKLNQWHSGQRS